MIDFSRLNTFPTFPKIGRDTLLAIRQYLDSSFRDYTVPNPLTPYKNQ
ncbi:hypothetical protein [uncultured Shewanella sp.]|nr:hypothetical protein [uncultured Shewanella sp.]